MAVLCVTVLRDAVCERRAGGSMSLQFSGGSMSLRFSGGSMSLQFSGSLTLAVDPLIATGQPLSRATGVLSQLTVAETPPLVHSVRQLTAAGDADTGSLCQTVHDVCFRPALLVTAAQSEYFRSPTF